MEVPGDMPLTIRDVMSMVADAVLLLLHVPPEVIWLSAVVWATQTLVMPAMPVIAALTVTTVMARHPPAVL
jgi:hypothetical protein